MEGKSPNFYVTEREAAELCCPQPEVKMKKDKQNPLVYWSGKVAEFLDENDLNLTVENVRRAFYFWRKDVTEKQVTKVYLFLKDEG